MADVPLPPCPQCGGELDLEMRRASMWVYCINAACGFEEEGRGG